MATGNVVTNLQNQQTILKEYRAETAKEIVAADIIGDVAEKVANDSIKDGNAQEAQAAQVINIATRVVEAGLIQKSIAIQKQQAAVEAELAVATGKISSEARAAIGERAADDLETLLKQSPGQFRSAYTEIADASINARANIGIAALDKVQFGDIEVEADPQNPTTFDYTNALGLVELRTWAEEAQIQYQQEIQATANETMGKYRNSLNPAPQGDADYYGEELISEFPIAKEIPEVPARDPYSSDQALLGQELSKTVKERTPPAIDPDDDPESAVITRNGQALTREPVRSSNARPVSLVSGDSQAAAISTALAAAAVLGRIPFNNEIVGTADPASVAASIPVDTRIQETFPGAVPAGEDPYVDEGPGLTEFTADGDVRWTEEDLENTADPFGDVPIQEEGGFFGEPLGVDPEEDPYAQLVDETEAQDGLVEFTQDGPVGRNTQQLAQEQARIQATLANARSQAALKAQRKQADDGDWRVKLRLAAGSDYLYRANDGNGNQAGILQPLVNTDGVIFPYTPTIQTNYKANYNAYDLTHSNYRGYFYQGSSVDEINLTATFTAQDTYEAQYLLAVIHFFRSVTKMFYGQDGNAGTPPPLVFLQGLGEYQYNLHPCLVSSFTYNLPNDVDYIRARSPNQANLPAGLLQARQRQSVATNPFSAAWQRLQAAGVPKGGMNRTPAPPTLGTKSPTYVPTKIDLQLVLLPVQSRSQVSKNFSLQKYANGDLLKGGFW